MRFEELYGLIVLRMILVMRYFKSFLIYMIGNYMMIFDMVF